MAKRLAHISDLHVGMNKSIEPSLRALAKSLKEQDIDKIVLTGDVTDHGLNKEFDIFKSVFSKFIDENKLLITPGNHDRTTDEVGKHFMKERIEVFENDNLFIINIDSTGKHNKKALNAHGIICNKVLNEVDAILNSAPQNKVIITMLHHHVIPLREEAFWEHVSRFMGFVFTLELNMGKELIELIKGRCDMLLFGHRHLPLSLEYPGIKQLFLYNAGATTIAKKYRLFDYNDGKLTSDPQWIHYY